MNQTQLKAAESYFEIPEMLKAFALGCLEGTQQQEILGITQRHYKDQALASSWYRAIRADVARCRSRIPKKEYSRINNIVGQIFTAMTKHGSATTRVPPNFHGTTKD